MSDSRSQMHILRDFVPFDDEACAVTAENGIRGVPDIPLRVIGGLGKDAFSVVTGSVTRGDAGKAASSGGIGCYR